MSNEPEVPWYARAFDSVYLEVYGHRDEREAEHATRHVLKPLGLDARRVLDLACGAGRHAGALSKHGARVVGLDLSTDLLARARREHGASADFVRGDMLRLPFATEAFDLVVNMFTSFGYFQREEDDRRALTEVRRVLRSNALLVLDVFNAEVVRRDLVPETHRRAGRFEVHEKRRIDPRHGTVIKDIELVDGETTHRYEEIVRLWTRAMLEVALRDHGFIVEKVWGDYDARAFDAARSPRLILQARACGSA